MLAKILLWAQMACPERTEKMSVHPDTSVLFLWWTSKKEGRWWGPAPLPHPQIPHLLLPSRCLGMAWQYRHIPMYILGLEKPCTRRLPGRHLLRSLRMCWSEALKFCSDDGGSFMAAAGPRTDVLQTLKQISLDIFQVTAYYWQKK